MFHFKCCIFIIAPSFMYIELYAFKNTNILWIEINLCSHFSTFCQNFVWASLSWRGFCRFLSQSSQQNFPFCHHMTINVKIDNGKTIKINITEKYSVYSNHQYKHYSNTQLIEISSDELVVIVVGYLENFWPIWSSERVGTRELPKKVCKQQMYIFHQK